MRHLLILVVMIGSLAWGGEEDVGATVLPLLKLSFSPRAAAMGGAYVGLSEDITGLWFNPAGLGGLDQGDALVAHHHWFSGIHDGYAGVAYPVGFKGTLGGGGIFALTRGIERWDEENNPQGEMSVSTGILSIAYARRLAQERLSLGLGLKGVYDNLGRVAGFGGGVDLGAKLRPFPGLGLGLSLRNIGILSYPAKSYTLPVGVRAGAAVYPSGSLKLLGDVELGLDRPISLHAGAEYRVLMGGSGSPALDIRAGYETGPQSIEELGVLSGIRWGVGIWRENLRFDYAFSPYGVLGWTHRFGMGVSFGERPKPGALIVEVRDGETGSPLSAELLFSGVHKRRVVTDSAGRYAAYWLRSGPVWIEASKVGYYPARDSARVVAPDTTTKVVKLYKVPPGEIRGRIYDLVTQEPLGATIGYGGVKSGECRAGEADGSYAIPGLPAGEYRLSVMPLHPRYLPQEALVEVEPGKTTVQDFGLLREREVIVLRDVNFETGRAELLPESYPALDLIGEILLKNPGIVVELAGHTDLRPIQTEEFPSNLELSQARAEACRQYLIRKFNLEPERLRAMGYGATQPLASNKTPQGMGLNRRTEFRVLSGSAYYQEFRRGEGRGGED